MAVRFLADAFLRTLAAPIAVALSLGCASDTTPSKTTDGSGGKQGTSGAGGAAGSPSTTATTTSTASTGAGGGTTAGSSVTSGGTAGASGANGGSSGTSGGDAGSAGASGSATGGAGGSAGSAGSGGNGMGGSAGTGGSAGSGGAGGGSSCKTLKDCLGTPVKNGGFAMPDYITWCSSVIKVGDTYHMFASRWPAQYGLGGWTMYSEAVRATSTNVLGPYTFQEVVLQKRTDNWDNTRIHNVRIVKAGNQYVLYYIDTANETGFAYADSITGPWTRQNAKAMTISNPAPFVRPDNSVYVFGRLADSTMVNRGIAFTAPTFMGPYTVVNGGANLLPNNYELEDPTIWWANNQYNVVVTDWKGLVTGTVKDGVEYRSKDGTSYELVSKASVFTKSIVYDDGSTEMCSRRERPFVYANENNEVIAFFTACLPESGPAHIVAQPVNRYVPSN